VRQFCIDWGCWGLYRATTTFDVVHFPFNCILSFSFGATAPPLGHGLLIHDVSRSHKTTHHSRLDSSGRVISSSQTDLYLTTHNTHNRQISIASGGIQTQNLSRRAAAELRLRPSGHWDRRAAIFYMCKIEHQLVAQCVNLLINAPTCFGLNCWPSSGSPQVFFFSVCRLCVNLCGRNCTYDWTYCNEY